MNNTTTHYWLGTCTTETIVGLFNPDLTAQLPTPNVFSIGDIVRVDEALTLYAPAHSALSQILQVLSRFGLDPVHPPEVTRAADAFLGTDFVADSTLVDLTALPFVTIDNPDSRDLDQAIYVLRENDGFDVYYALADASWFVAPGSPLFEEALERGVTYYAPDFSVRMLPAVLSENLVSLNEGVERRAMVFHIKLDRKGGVTDTRVERAVIRSRAKLSYGQVQTVYDRHEAGKDLSTGTSEWHDSLLSMQELGRLRIEDARRRDVVEFNRREAQVVIDPADDNRLVIVVRERNDAEKYNEQMSLLCNIEGARLLQSRQSLSDELHAVYRVHKPPVAMKLEDFRDTLQNLINSHQLDSQFQWQSGVSLADYIANLPQKPEYAALRQTIERLAMLTNRASTFESEPDQHFALGVDAYARFSSPMREIVGIFTHKELFECLGFSAVKDTHSDDKLRALVIERANEAKSLQRKLEKEFQLLALDSFLNDDLETPIDKREWHTGVIVGMRTNRIYLHLDGLALEIKLYLEDLNRSYQCNYQLDGIRAIPGYADSEATRSEEGPILMMGNRLKVQVSSLDTARRRYLFNLQSD